jgi:hypothetical protein
MTTHEHTHGEHVVHESARQALIIAGIGFHIPAPYTAGHTLTEAEASAVNQLFAENIRNNFAKHVKDAKGEAATLDREIQISLQTKLDEYAVAYSFERKRASGPARAKMDPVEKEAHRLAGLVVEAALNAKGIKKKDLPTEKFNEYVATALERKPEIRETARKQVEALSAVAHAALDALGDEPTEQSAE